MRKDVYRALVVLVVGIAFLGILSPIVFTVFAQAVFPNQANGSLIKVNGKTVGSKLIGQLFTGPRYFHGRPSATTPPYNAMATTFSNLGPNSKDLATLVKQRIQAILKLEGPYNPGLSVRQIPVDAVTTSASGIDPEISKAYALLQAPRIAAVRHLPLATVHQLIDDHVDGRSLGFLGEPGVNVLELNLALDQEH
jgi:potassium-transporting ATPase KdpC subunit